MRVPDRPAYNRIQFVRLLKTPPWATCRIRDGILEGKAGPSGAPYHLKVVWTGGTESPPQPISIWHRGQRWVPATGHERELRVRIRAPRR